MKKWILSTLVLAIYAGRLLAQDTTIVQNAPFHTENQSLWKPGAAGLVDIDYPFFSIGWNESGSFGGIESVAGFDFGAEITAGTWGSMGSGLRIEFGNERVDIDYPVNVSMKMPKAFAFNKGQEVTIETSFNPLAANCKILPDTYNVVLQIWFAMGFGFDIGGEFCFFSCDDYDIIDIDMPVDTFDIVYISNSTGISLLDGMYEWPVGDYLPFSYTDDKDIITVNLDMPTNGGASSHLEGINLISKITPDRYADAYFDIPKFIGALNIPYVSAFFGNLSNTWELGPIEVGYIIMRTGFFLGLYHNQTLTFRPTVKTSMQFPTAVDYKVLTPTNGLVESGVSSNITLNVGNKLRFRYPCNYEFLDISPTHSIRNSFTNHTYDSIAFDFVFQMLEFHISMEDVEVIPGYTIPVYVPCGPWYCYVCDWCHDYDIVIPPIVFHGFYWGFGPLVDLQPNIANVKYNWVNNTWEMQGFSPFTRPTFRLRPAKFSVSAVATAINCFGANTGSITATVTNGTPPYRYEWSNGTVNISSLTSNTVNNLPPGTHYCIVTDANGCVTFIEVIVNQPAQALTIASSVTDVLCNGGNTGAINQTISGGTAPYTFSWLSGQNTEDISSLVAGNYTVTVTDNRMCTKIQQYTVSQPAQLISTPSQTNVNCRGDASGSASVLVNGGVPPYSYLWTGGSTLDYISNVSAGLYTVTATDYNGCTSITNFNISQPIQALGLSVNIQDVYCNGEASGAIQLTPSGGTTPYDVQWLNNAGQIINYNGIQLDSIAEGNYTAIVEDALGCLFDTTVYVAQPAAIVFTSALTDILCFGQSTGVIDINVSGGNGSYSYSWSNGSSNEDLTAIAAGTYDLTITDNLGCTKTTTFTLNQPGAPLAASIQAQANRCYGLNDGIADLSVSGGTAPYTYLWSNGASTEDLQFIAAGVYTVIITDNNGCTANSGTVITQPADSLALSIIVNDADCAGNEDGSITIVPSGGTTPYYLRWDDIDYVISNGSHILDGLGAGIWQVIVSDANGCKSIRNIEVNEPDPIVLTTNSSIVSCFGGNDGNIGLMVDGGTSPYAYLWSNGLTTANLTGLEQGTYTVTVTDNQGCESETTVLVSQMPQIVTSSAVIPVSCSENHDGSITLSSAGGSGNYSYLWAGGSTSDNLSGLYPGTYSVTVTDDLGCQRTYEYIIAESYTACIFIPSSFSPNQDGKNDTWIIRNIDLYPGHVVKIFNRWGNLLDEQSPYTKPWEGTYNGNPLPAETYYYIIDLNNGQVPFNGTVTIVR